MKKAINKNKVLKMLCANQHSVGSEFNEYNLKLKSWHVATVIEDKTTGVFDITYEFTPSGECSKAQRSTLTYSAELLSEWLCDVICNSGVIVE